MLFVLVGVGTLVSHERRHPEIFVVVATVCALSDCLEYEYSLLLGLELSRF